MGVDGHFFDLAVSARTELRLRDLPKIGNLAVAGVDASIWVHQLARTVDPLVWSKLCSFNDRDARGPF